MLIDIMNTIWNWVDNIVNNPNDPPSTRIEIFPSHTNIPAPSGTYITISSTPALTTLGYADWEVTEESGIFYKTLRTNYEGIVEIWESNGNGDLLVKICNHQWMQDAIDILRSNYISYLRDNGIIFTPILQGDEWEHESVLEVVFGFGKGLKYEVDVIEDVEMNGTLTLPNGATKNVYIDKDI